MYIFNIQHFSTGDGSGIRTTIFLAGCNLRCPWCHNPEALYGMSDLRNMSLDEITADVMSDWEFYVKSSGGVTISGGEPLFSYADTLMLAREFKSRELNIIIDTALAVDGIDFNELCGCTDCFLVDIKTADAVRFNEVCKGDFDVYTANIERLCELGADMIFRVPLIPGFNTDDESIDRIAALALKYGKPVSLLPFHRLASAKYRKLGIPYLYAEIQPLEKSEIKRISNRFADNGITFADI